MANQGGGDNEQELVLGNVRRNTDDRDRVLNAYAQPNLDGLNSNIMIPEIQAAHFELKPVMFQMLQTVGQFSGLPTEDPHLHLRLFIEVTDAFKMNGVIDEVLKLKLFSYSLTDQARAWLNSLPPNSIATWNDLAEKFLMNYFSPTKNAKLRNDVTSFQQLDGESLYETYERYKELQKRCHHHGIPYWIQMETFYNGLNAQTRTIVDAKANGALLSKTYNEAYELLERMACENLTFFRPPTRLNTQYSNLRS